MSFSLRILIKKFNKPLILSRLCPVSQLHVHSHTYCTAQPKSSEEFTKYSTSKAANWKAASSLYGEEADDIPWYQPHVIVLSTVIFFLYFCVLREENDIDQKLYRPLYETIPQSEKSYLILTIEKLKSEGKDYKQYEARLKELEGKL